MISRILILLIAATLNVAYGGSEPTTAEEKKAEGDRLLREMSKTVAGMKTMSFTAEVVSDKVDSGGQKAQRHVVQHVVVRRPNAFTIRTEEDQGMNAWYDGKELTLVSDAEKVWARGPVPPTLDKAMDYVADTYDLKLAWGDLLYSSPYEALTHTDTAGGWVGEETIEGTECDHLSYQEPVVDWQIWVTRAGHRPKQLQITYKLDPGQPVTLVTFRDLELSPSIDKSTFMAKVPKGYAKIPLVRHSDETEAPDETEKGSSPAAPAPAPAGQ